MVNLATPYQYRSEPSWTTPISSSLAWLATVRPRLDRPQRRLDGISSFFVANGHESAWHGHKYIDPAESGAIIPIVHVNGFKISEPTIYGRMDDKELVALFTGYGYQPRLVEDLDDIDADLSASLDWAVDEIHKIQKAARSGSPIAKPRWPVLIMRTPKVWCLGEAFV